MDISHLIRDPVKVKEALKEINNSLIAIHPCKIYIPEHYIGAELGNIAEETYILATYGIVVEDKYYGVSRACALMQIEPSGSNTVEIQGLKYLEFSFNKGDAVIKNLNLVKTGTLVYRVYVDIISKGKVPWYFNQEDLGFIFDTAKEHANADLHTDSALLELIASSMARQKSNKTKFFRHDNQLKSVAKLTHKPSFIPLMSVSLQVVNTTSKLLGNYHSEAITSALVNPSTESSSLEELLRK